MVRAESMGFNARPDTIEGFNAAAAIGPRVMRIAYENSWIQTGGWAKFDRMVRIAHDRDMKVIANALGTYGFPGAGHTLAGPAGDWKPVLQFRDYCVGLADHGADYIEFWNEPNHPNFDKGGPNPAAWALYMTVAAAAVRKVHPGLVTISGGLAPHGDLLKPDGATPLPYFATALRAVPAMLDNIDLLGWHVYTNFNGADPLTNDYRWNSAAQIADQAAIGGQTFKGLVSLGRGKPVAVTECGCPVSGTTGSKTWNPDDAAKQLDKTFAALDAHRAHGVNIPLTIVHCLYDDPTPIDVGTPFGVLNQDGSWRSTAHAVHREAMRAS